MLRRPLSQFLSESVKFTSVGHLCLQEQRKSKFETMLRRTLSEFVLKSVQAHKISLHTRGLTNQVEEIKKANKIERDKFSADLERKIKDLPDDALIWHTDACYHESIPSTGYSGLVRKRDNKTVDFAYCGIPLKGEYTLSSLNEKMYALRRGQDLGEYMGVKKVLFITDCLDCVRLMEQLKAGIELEYEPVPDIVEFGKLTKTKLKKLMKQQKVILSNLVYGKRIMFEYCDWAWGKDSPGDTLSKQCPILPLDLTRKYQSEQYPRQKLRVLNEDYLQTLFHCKKVMRQELNKDISVNDRRVASLIDDRDHQSHELLKLKSQFPSLTLNEFSQMANIVEMEVVRGHEIPFNPFENQSLQKRSSRNRQCY